MFRLDQNAAAKRRNRWGCAFHGNGWGLGDPNSGLLSYGFDFFFFFFTRGPSSVLSISIFGSLEVFVAVVVFMLVSACLAGLCAV